MPRAADSVFGILYFDGGRHVTADELRRVASLVAAPAAAIELDGNFGIGIERHLVDAPGQSAVVSKASDLWVAVTGEIDNRVALIEDLARRGVRPESPADADVVAALWRSRGADAAAALEGYFNAVVWDRRRQRLVLVADHCAAVKALYHYRGPGFLAFGSTLKAVLAHEDKVPRRLDGTAIEDLFILRHPVSPATMVAGVSVLEAGTCVDVADGVARPRRYWRRRPWNDTGADLAMLERDYFRALEHAVARCAAGDDVCVMSSGGVDSAAVVSLLRRAGVDRVRTFSVHIGPEQQSDRAGSQEIARRFRTEHVSLDDLDARCLDSLPEMIWNYEAAAVDFHPTYYLARRMRDECDVVLGGYGNDLLWGVARPRWITGAVARRLLPPLNELHYLAIRRKLGRRALRRLQPAAPHTDVGVLRRAASCRARTGDGLADAIALDEGLFGDQVVYREIGKVLVDAHGLWPRLPFTDADVVRIAESVPPAARMAQRGGRIERKAFFKRVMEKEGVLPPEIIYRRKTWMNAPTAAWLRGDLGRRVRTLLLGSRARARGLFDSDCVNRLLDRHQAGRADHAYALMMLVAIELWLRLFIDAPSLAPPDFTLSDCAAEPD